MPTPLCAWKRLVVLGLTVSVPLVVSAQDSPSPQGGEYLIAGPLAGDQLHPQVKINLDGGYVVWQDNHTDGEGLGISAQRIDQSLFGTLATFRVNETAAGDQEHPQLALLKNGGAVFVWQGGRLGFQDIFARFMAPDGTFMTGDILVNTFTANQQLHPKICSLADGSVVVVWTSYGQDDPNSSDPALRGLQGVFGQRFSAAGEKLGAEFQVNTSIRLNQRTPCVAPLGDGFIVVWLSEKLARIVHSRGFLGSGAEITGGAEQYDVDVVGRIFDASGAAQAGEVPLNAGGTICATPDLSALADGGFAVAWSQRSADLLPGTIKNNAGWDVFGRCFDAAGNPRGDQRPLNTETRRNQLSPRLAPAGSALAVVWVSDAQDGYQEGVFGQFLSSEGAFIGSEFKVNTTITSQQYQPAIAFDGDRTVMVVWTSYTLGGVAFDLFAQRYSSGESLPVPAPPFVSPLSQSRLLVSWPEAAGYEVDHYQLYIDGQPDAVVVSANYHQVGQLAAGTTHSFKIAYKLKDGRVSPISAATTGKTWGEDGNFDGLPDDWQSSFWNGSAGFPRSDADSDNDGASNVQEFLAGTSPLDPASVLRTQIISTSQGLRLQWNSKPGSIYQVQSASNVNVWTSVDKPRFAVGLSDSIPVAAGNTVSLYRIIRVR